MDALPDLHERALATTRQFVAGVGPDQWAAPSPCEGWDARELLNHIIGGNLWVAELVDGKTIAEVGDRLDGDVVGDDPLAAYDRSAGAASAAFQRPGAMKDPVAVSYGPVPGEIYAGHRFIDVLIHGWDLAKATGQDASLPADLVDACSEVVAPQAELLVGSGAFGDGSVDVPDGGDPQTVLLARLGRTA
jgi:uncharacterized protein (TIGR03086 family)